MSISKCPSSFASEASFGLSLTILLPGTVLASCAGCRGLRRLPGRYGVWPWRRPNDSPLARSDELRYNTRQFFEEKPKRKT